MARKRNQADVEDEPPEQLDPEDFEDDDESDLETYDDEPLPDALPQVAQSESDILTLARALIAGPAATDDVWSLLCATGVVAPKIGPTCERLLSDTLGQAWRALWQRGGTRPRVSHEGKRGRLWERYAPTPLAFSARSLELLRWLVVTPFAAPLSTLKPLPTGGKLEVGDQLLIYLALDAAQGTPALRVLAAQPFVQASPLAWIGFASQFAGTTPPESFDSLITGAGPIVVEALSDEIARRWHALEISRRNLVDPTEVTAIGAAQDAALENFLDACDRANRRDLAAFVLDAILPLIERDIIPVPTQLDPSTPLSVRAEARQSSGALLRALMRWSQWDREHRGVRFIDDGYDAAQVLLGRFEKIGSAGVARVEGWLGELASLAPTAAPPPAP